MNHRSDIRRHYIVCVLLGVLALCMTAEASQARPQVLLIFDEDKDLPGLAVINRNIQQVLRAQQGQVEFFSESLNLSQFNNADHSGVLREYFRRKYQGRQIDLIIAVMEPSLDFLLRNSDVLFPGVPIVFSGLNPVEVATRTLPGNVTGVLVKRNFAMTLELALRLQPQTRRVVIVGGTSRFDRQILAVARRDLEGFANRVPMTWLTDRPMQQLLPELAALPSHSIIYYLTMFSDGAGEAFIPHEALERIAQVANAPIYVANDQFVGRGSVGGYVYSVEHLGQQTAAVGLRILRGEPVSSIPIESASVHRHLFDWRQLARWRIDERRLPADSEVVHRPMSLWYLYKWYILIGAVAFVLQSGLLVGLLLSRHQRRRAEFMRAESEEHRVRAENEVLRQRDELAHALRVATLGEMTASFTHELAQPLSAIMMNTDAARKLMEREGTEWDVSEALQAVSSDANRASEILRRLRTLFRKQPLKREQVDIGAVIEDALRLLENELNQRKVHPQFARHPRPIHVLGDAVQLQQVLINLVINAADAIAANDEAQRLIHIEIHQPASSAVQITVRDSGVGVEESALERIFEHFVTTKPKGLGMGLAISRSIIEAHGGRLWATRNEDRGLTMRVQLPAVPPV